MIRALAAALVALSLAAAGCSPCEPAYDLTMTGVPAPADAALVIEIAQAHCDRPIVGTLEFLAEPDQNGDRGHCRWAAHDCPMDAHVTVPSNDPLAPTQSLPGPNGVFYSAPCEVGGALHDSALCTPMAHEIGHWCTLSSNQDDAENWGNAVIVEALQKKGIEL